MVSALLVVVVWGLAQASPLLVPLSISALLAFLLAPLVRAMRRARVPELLAITISAILLLLPFSALGYLLVKQGTALSRDFPRIVTSLDAFLGNFSSTWLGQKLQLESDINVSRITDRLAASAGQGLEILLAGLGALLNAGSQTALVLLYTVLMLAARGHLRRSFERILARNRSLEAAFMLDEIAVLIERFLIARSAIVAIIAAADLLILVAFKIKYAFLLASFLGVMTLVPAIGFILAVIPPIIVSVAQGHGLISTLGLTGALLTMSAIEGNVLTPKLVGKSLNINALATFVGLFAGALLWGVWGMLLSIPILGILRIAFSRDPALAPWGELLADKPANGSSTTAFQSSRAGNA